MFKKIMKKITYLTLTAFIVAQGGMLAGTALAAEADLSVSTPSEVKLIKGCPAEIKIKMNTNGENILASDTTLNLTGSATIDEVSIGDILPMQTYNQVTGSQIKLSGARYPASGGFNGNGVFGTINITPGMDANSITIGFSPNMTIDNNVINESIVNVLGSVTGATYPVQNRYNPEIGGGFCTPDTTAPVFSLLDPLANSHNNPANTNVVFAISDDRSGVNINTLQFTINNSVQVGNVTTEAIGGMYRITVDPSADFGLGTQVSVKIVNVCDNDGNCLVNQTKTFRIVPPPTCGDGNVDVGEECDDGSQNGNMNSCTSSCNIAVCGDGYLWWGNEACDDGNTQSQDGCSADCNLEAPSVIETFISAQCPVCSVCAELKCVACEECEICEPEVIIEYLQPEEVTEEEQDEAVQTATRITEEVVTTTKVEYKVEILDACAEYSNRDDLDSDGLTDRTECYMGTDPQDDDTDGDTCKDGDEVNQFITDPLKKDCEIKEKIAGEVTITDPQPGWIVSQLKISGITPSNTVSVDIVAFPSGTAIMNKLVKELTRIITTESTSFTTLSAYLEEAAIFIATYEDKFDYAEMAEAVAKLDNIVTLLKERVKAGEDVFVNRLSENLIELQSLLKVSVYLGKSLPNPENITETGSLRFTLTPAAAPLADDKLYDLIATATLDDDTQISSKPIRINLDKEAGVSRPIPQYIGGKRIPTFIAEGLLVEGAVKEVFDVLEIEISDERPVISGSSEYGAQVFAVWESIVLSSSVITDSEQGEFEIQAPQNLTPNEPHKVTLYALKTDGDQKVRSENIEIYFKITKEKTNWVLIFGLLGILMVMAVLFFYLRRVLTSSGK